MKKSDLNKIRKLLKSTFESDLFEACLSNLGDKSNKLRFNNFAYSIRELSRHMLYNLAPYDEVINCSWYKNETKLPQKLSRGERIKYAIQGGFTDKFVNDEIIEIEAINKLKKEIKNSIELLNKYTHINSKTFNIPKKEINENSNQIIEAFKNFAETIEESRQTVYDELENKIHDEFISHCVYRDHDNLDFLATHYELEDISPEAFHISKIRSQSLIIETNGSTHIRLQWGSNKDLETDLGAEMYTSFPFQCKIKVGINKKLKDASISIEDFEIDTRNWYE